jgi:peptide/nickel transport system substrate-binding protein
VYQGYADPLATPLGTGNKAWIAADIPPPVHSVERAREILKADGFKWNRDGALQDAEGQNVRFSIIATTSNPERVQIATLIQADLKPLGIEVDIAPLDFPSLIDRVTRTRNYEASIFAISSGDVDPNAELMVWLSNGTMHLWHLQQTKPATAWEAEIDSLMKRLLIIPRYEERKKLFDRVQEIAMENLPVIPLVSPHLLVGAKKILGNFRPAIMEPYILWNIEELFWHRPKPGGGQ